jgi:hypothetical protein
MVLGKHWITTYFFRKSSHQPLAAALAGSDPMSR